MNFDIVKYPTCNNTINDSDFIGTATQIDVTNDYPLFPMQQ